MPRDRFAIKGASFLPSFSQAISNPRDETLQSAAWGTVVPSVRKLLRFFHFGLRLGNQGVVRRLNVFLVKQCFITEEVVPKLLMALCCGPLTPYEHLKTQQSLVKQFAEILDFVLKFDDLKMTNPAIQNDFSYYRRSMSRMRRANDDKDPSDDTFELSGETANLMSLFYAHPTPMLKVLSDSTSKFVANNRDLPIGNTTETLSTMARICQKMIENP